ncbi:MAG: hypothetical protein R2684_01620 [Pyrinomonadaceae bacterium]
MENKLQTRPKEAIKEKTQYVLTFGVIAAMLYVAQFPSMVIFFFGIFAYFLWKALSKPTANAARELFEFYMASNEILRDDGRRWFGFEVSEVIHKGERILKHMNGAPPLVYFALGALHARGGDHAAAVELLSYVVENAGSDESTYLHPSEELREYVSMLRKIEREPAKEPQLSAAIRSLERAREEGAEALLASSRAALESSKEAEKLSGGVDETASKSTTSTSGTVVAESDRDRLHEQENRSDHPGHPRGPKPITEILHDIYDKNIQ